MHLYSAFTMVIQNFSFVSNVGSRNADDAARNANDATRNADDAGACPQRTLEDDMREVNKLISEKSNSPRLAELAVRIGDKDIIYKVSELVEDDGVEILAEWAYDHNDKDLGRKLLKRPVSDGLSRNPEFLYEMALKAGDVNTAIKLNEHKAHIACPLEDRRTWATNALNLLQWAERAPKLAESSIKSYLVSEEPAGVSKFRALVRC